MYQFTTPTITITFPRDFDLRSIRELVLTLKQGSITLEKGIREVVIDDRSHTISCTLTQEDTGKFNTGVLEVQAHIKIAGTVYATNIMRAEVMTNLHKEVI